MSEAPLWVWAALALLLLVSSVFSSSETALFSLTESQRARAGLTVRRLLARPRDLLVVVLIGNLIVNLLFFTVALRLHPLEGGSLLVDVGALVALLLCGEILPKTFGLRARIGVARTFAPLILLLSWLLSPVRRVLIRLLEVIGALVGRFIRDDAGLAPEDLARLLESGAQEGDFDMVEADLLAEIVELGDIRVREIMTPRVDCVFLELGGDEREAVAREALLNKVSWLPVADGTPDRVVGRVRVRDLINRPDRTVAQLVMPVKFVPEVASALDLLRTLQEDRAAEAVVLDEWGGTAGLVTIEDVFEEIVGELRAEGESREHAAIPLGEGRFRVPGGLSIRDWNDRFGFRVVPTEFETVGGFITALLGRIPRTGDVAGYGNLVLEVHESRGRRVLAVDISVKEESR